MGFSFGRKLRSGLIGGDKIWNGDDLETEDDVAYVEGMRLRALRLTPHDSSLVGRGRDVLWHLWRVWGDAWSRDIGIIHGCLRRVCGERNRLTVRL